MRYHLVTSHFQLIFLVSSPELEIFLYFYLISIVCNIGKKASTTCYVILIHILQSLSLYTVFIIWRNRLKNVGKWAKFHHKRWHKKLKMLQNETHNEFKNLMKMEIFRPRLHTSKILSPYPRYAFINNDEFQIRKKSHIENWVCLA